MAIRNTIIAGNTAHNFAPDVSGSVSSQGHNLIGDGTGGSGFDPTDLVGMSDNLIAPRLGPLQNNGGLTPTMALLPGSPAIDAGDNTDAPPWDQRGPAFARVVHGTIDIGAFEVQPASTVAWINPAGGPWEVAANWSGGRVPGPDDDVLIGALHPGAAAHLSSGADAVGSLASGGGLVVSSSLTVAGSYEQYGGSLLLAGGTVTVGGLLDLQGGALSGSGTINGNVQNAAVVSPGTATAPGVLTINGDYFQTASGTLSLYIGGTQAGTDYSQLVVNGFATLDGTLAVTLTNGYQPQPGDQLQPLLFAQGQGTFARYTEDVGGFSFLYVYDDGGFLPPGLTLVAN
jgi:hypothetical protein